MLQLMLNPAYLEMLEESIAAHVLLTHSRPGRPFRGESKENETKHVWMNVPNSSVKQRVL